MKRNFLDNLVEFTGVTVTMDRDQYISYKNNELTLAEIKMLNSIEKNIFDNLKKDKKFERNIIVAIAFFLHLTNTTTIFAAENPTQKIDELGRKLLNIIQVAGYWICLIMCGLMVLRAIMSGKDKKQIGEIVISFILAFAALYFMPWLFDTVKTTFGGQ